MKLPPGLAGRTVGPRTHAIDARWLMAYAAALGESAPEYLDTCRPDGILPHPLFPVCYEWPLALDLRAGVLPEEIAVRSVHATHDLRIHRRARVGDRLSARATVIAVEPRAPGAYVLTRFETVDASGAPVSTTDFGSIYLGVACEPSGTRPPELPRSPLPEPHRGARPTGEEGSGHGGASPPTWSEAVPIAPTLAHVYTEGARIWNPIHTDRAVARQAGLPDIILHGTATLALAVSRVLAREPGGPGTLVNRIACRFGGMVRLPSTLTVEGLGAGESADGRWLAFRALSADGRPAVRDGLIGVAPGGPG